MKTVRTTLALVAVAALALAVGVWAQTGGATQQPPQGHGQMGHGGPGGMRGGPMAMLGQLNLTQDQMNQVHKIMADAQPQVQADMEQMQKLHEQLRDQVFGENGPTGSEGATAEQISALQAKMIQSHVALADQMSGILTADQRKKIREMPMGELMGMMGGMMGPGHMGRGGRL